MALKRKKIDYKTLNQGKRFANEELYTEVGEQLGIHRSVVKEIADIQDKVTAETIQSGNMETVILVYLGKLKVNYSRVQKMMANSMRK